MMGIPWMHGNMMWGSGFGFGFFGWIIDLLVTGAVVYFAVKLALKNSNK
ncbi:hypothetical protein [Bacillus kwashiorkori]|nr:hypothetical protein [Bacillus kwashiorkori]